ncbi:MAG: TRAP transporter small permease [Pseudomonadota bacterium]
MKKSRQEEVPLEKSWMGWKFFDMIIKLFAILAGALLLLVTLFVSYSVIVRYMGFSPPIWILQYTEYALLWITFLGATWLLKHEGHIRIDTLVTRFSSKNQRKFDIASTLLAAGVSFVIAWFGARTTIDLYQRDIMDVKGVILPMYPLFLIIPLGGMLLLIQCIRKLFDNIKGLREG